MIVILHRNTSLVGSLDSNVQLWERHDLKRAYLESGLSIKYFTLVDIHILHTRFIFYIWHVAIHIFYLRTPTIPTGLLGGNEDGYLLSTPQERRASYFVAMDTLGLINENGCDLSLDRWLDSSFLLPYKLSHELNSYSADLHDRILQTPTVKNGKSRLYLEFHSPTTYVIRLVIPVLYCTVLYYTVLY